MKRKTRLKGLVAAGAFIVGSLAGPVALGQETSSGGTEDQTTQELIVNAQGYVWPESYALLAPYDGKMVELPKVGDLLLPPDWRLEQSTPVTRVRSEVVEGKLDDLAREIYLRSDAIVEAGMDEIEFDAQVFAEDTAGDYLRQTRLAEAINGTFPLLSLTDLQSYRRMLAAPNSLEPTIASLIDIIKRDSSVDDPEVVRRALLAKAKKEHRARALAGKAIGLAETPHSPKLIPFNKPNQNTVIATTIPRIVNDFSMGEEGEDVQEPSKVCSDALRYWSAVVDNDVQTDDDKRVLRPNFLSSFAAQSNYLDALNGDCQKLEASEEQFLRYIADLRQVIGLVMSGYQQGSTREGLDFDQMTWFGSEGDSSYRNDVILSVLRVFPGDFRTSIDQPLPPKIPQLERLLTWLVLSSRHRFGFSGKVLDLREAASDFVWNGKDSAPQSSFLSDFAADGEALEREVDSILEDSNPYRQQIRSLILHHRASLVTNLARLSSASVAYDLAASQQASINQFRMNLRLLASKYETEAEKLRRSYIDLYSAYDFGRVFPPVPALVTGVNATEGNSVFRGSEIVSASAMGSFTAEVTVPNEPLAAAMFQPGTQLSVEIEVPPQVPLTAHQRAAIEASDKREELLSLLESLNSAMAGPTPFQAAVRGIRRRGNELDVSLTMWHPGLAPWLELESNQFDEAELSDLSNLGFEVRRGFKMPTLLPQNGAVEIADDFGGETTEIFFPAGLILPSRSYSMKFSPIDPLTAAAIAARR